MLKYHLVNFMLKKLDFFVLVFNRRGNRKHNILLSVSILNLFIEILKTSNEWKIIKKLIENNLKSIKTSTTSFSEIFI